MATIEQRRGKDGGIAFRVRVRIKGSRQITKTFERKTDAKRWAAQAEAQVREGADFGVSRKTLGDAIERYAAEELPRLAKTEQGNRNLQLGWWKGYWGHLLLREVTRWQVSQALRAFRETGRRGRPVTIATCNRYKAALSAVLSAAVEEWQWLAQHPLRGAGRRKRPKGERERERDRELEPEEWRRLLDACRESRDARLYALVVCAYCSGARQGELMGIEWGRVQLSPAVFVPELGASRPGVARAVVVDTKSGGDRVLYFPGEAGEVLRKEARTPRLSRFVFAGPSDAPEVRPRFPQGAWRYAVERAGVEDLRFHDLRHSWACRLLDAGATLAQLMIQGGWRSPVMVARYARRAQREGGGTVERLDALLRVE